MAVGSVVVALSCFLRILPYFIYGPGEDALKYTAEYGAANNISLEQGKWNESVKFISIYFLNYTYNRPKYLLNIFYIFSKTL